MDLSILLVFEKLQQHVQLGQIVHIILFCAVLRQVSQRIPHIPNLERDEGLNGNDDVANVLTFVTAVRDVNADVDHVVEALM